MTPDDVRTIRNTAGRKPYEVAVGGRARHDDWEAERTWMRAVADAGADWWAEWVPPSERETMRSAVERGPLRIEGGRTDRNGG